MTYEEKKAAERAADLAKPFLQRQECRNDQQYRPLLLEPVIDREKLKRKAKLVKKMRSTRWPEEMLHESNPEDKEALEDEYEQFEDEMRDHPTIGIFTRGSDGKVTLRPADEPAAQEPAATEPEPDTKLCCAVDHGTGCASRTYHGTDCPGAESCPVKQYEDEECERENAEMGAALRRNREDATAQEPAATNPEPGPAAQEPATLTIREMILEHGINPDDIDGLAECGDLKVDRRVYREHISENGVIFECEENIRLWLLRRSRDDDKHFTIEVAPWNLADDGPYGPFIDTTCRPWEDMEPPMSEHDWVEANIDPKTQNSIPQPSDYLGTEPEEQDEDEPAAMEPAPLDYLDTEDDNARNEGRDEYIECSAYLRGEAYDREDYIKANPEDYDNNGNWIGYAAATEGDGYQQWTDIQARRGKTA